QGSHGSGPVGVDVQPQVRELRLQAGKGIHLQPTVVLPDRPGLREVRLAVPRPVMPLSVWVASTKPEAALARAQGWQPWQERGWTLAPRDRGPEADMYCWKGHYRPPNLRSRCAYSARAARKSSSPKSGQGFSTKTSSAYASCHSRKFEIRWSPAVRISRSGSGSSGSYSAR